MEIHPHIVHVSSVHKPWDGRIFEKQCRFLAANGIKTSFVVAADEPENRDGVQIVPFTRSSSADRIRRILFDSRRAIQTALSLNADIYHLHDPELLLNAHLLKRHGKLFIFDMHENLPKAIGDKHWLPRHTRVGVAAFTALFERFSLRNTPVIFAEDSYKNDYPWIRNYRIVRNFPDVNRFTQLRKSREPVKRIAYFGGVSPDRGSINMLLALAQLQKTGLSVGFECVGPCTATHQRDLQGICEQEGLRDITFHGPRKPGEGYAIIRDCSVGLAVLRPRANYVGSYPTKLFEYLCLGMPVVTSDFPLYQELIKRISGGVCVDPLSPSAIAKAIEKLIANPQQAQKLAEDGYRALLRQGLTWDAEFLRLLDLYKCVLGTTGRMLPLASEIKG